MPALAHWARVRAGRRAVDRHVPGSSTCQHRLPRPMSDPTCMPHPFGMGKLLAPLSPPTHSTSVALERRSSMGGVIGPWSSVSQSLAVHALLGEASRAAGAVSLHDWTIHPSGVHDLSCAPNFFGRSAPACDSHPPSPSGLALLRTLGSLVSHRLDVRTAASDSWPAPQPPWPAPFLQSVFRHKKGAPTSCTMS